jgi:phage minor structural protein
LITTLDLNRNITSYLENAFSIGYEKVSNQIWSASFSLPINDPKISKVKLLKYVEIDDVGLFRIIPKLTKKSANSITYQCEHVLATLLGSTLFKYHQLTNYTTRNSLQYLIDQQKEKHWKLGTVEFTRYFSYSWENENLLSAIFSIPKGFDEQYRWTWDTSYYPWTLNLVKPDSEPLCRIKEGYNLVDFEIEENPMSIYNRIYPLGVGEGVNQLGIESVNNGVPYIEDAESIAENGIIETVWVDKRFEDAATLIANGKAVLKKWKEPVVTWTVSAADVSSITRLSVDELKEGKVVRLQLDDYPELDLRIMKESKSDMIGNPGDVKLEIGNLTEDLSTIQADMERRQRINELVSQGATNIDTRDFQDNCDSTHPAIIRFPIPNDLVNINEMLLTFETQKFRAYERAIKGGGAVATSTSSGGGSTQTSSSGGGSTQTSSTGGQATVTSASGGGTSETSSIATFTDNILSTEKPISGVPFDTHTHVIIGGSNLSHSHDVTIPNHSHSVSVPSHSHSVNIPNHTHDVSTPNHTHNVTIPDHTHDIEFGIFELDETPSQVTIEVDGQQVPFTQTSGDNINLIPYLSKDSDGKIQRGRYVEIKITPNNLARINATVTSRIFIQSRIGGTF